MVAGDEFLICTACGTEFDETDDTKLRDCRICDDPRQFIPPQGQTFTTHSQLSHSHHNKHTPFTSDPRFHSLSTEPKFAIGQRCILIQTPHGNLLWDCIALLDEPTITWINGLGGLQGIVVSHPHYYTTHLRWAKTFACPVYLARVDAAWLCTADPLHRRIFIEPEETVFEVPRKSRGRLGEAPGLDVRILQLGGHFPGSLVCLYEGRLLIADTFVTTPSGLGPLKKGMNSFVFMWSIPNMIPLPPSTIAGMWTVLRQHAFHSTHGAFVGTDVEAADVKRRVLDSMKIQIRAEGWPRDALLLEDI